MRQLKWLLSYNGLPFTFTIFYIVGLVLFFLPITQDVFISITPYSLAMVTAAVFYYHREWNVRSIGVLASIFLLSIAVEVMGVSTGKLFGVYTYGETLGFKIFSVPIVIGLNWMLLIYGSNGIGTRLTSNPYLKILIASVLMVLYDLMLEVVAPVMDMWAFEQGSPPFQNYLSWFVLSVVFHSALEIFKINTNNKTGSALFIIQVLFFLSILLGRSILQS